MDDLEILVRLVAATAFGAAIGWERERKRKPAGLRTHALVGLASALMIAAVDAALLGGADPSGVSRAVQGVVTGVGFIGAGAILRYEGGVAGITTAASIWMAAGLGVAAGLGEYLLGVAGVVLGFIVLLLLRELEPTGGE
ncbi:MAG TPA: MgtC/SapB family protein [Dehalococcoidia bacterium]